MINSGKLVSLVKSMDKEWGNIWDRAWHASPKMRSNLDGPPWGDRYDTLALLLGFSSISEMSQSLCKDPKDPEVTRKLMLLAGPYGKTLARIKLKQLGIIDNYQLDEAKDG